MVGSNHGKAGPVGRRGLVKNTNLTNLFLAE